MGDTTLERIALSGKSFIAGIRRAARLAALGALAVFAAGCSTEDSEGAAVSQRQQSAVIGTVTVRIVSGDIKDATPTANAFLDLRDRSSIKSASGTPLPLYNFGNVSTQVGAQVTSGSITSVASVLLRNQTVVQGNVTSGGTITTQAGVTVTGQKLQNQTIPAPVEVSWEVPLAANPGNPRTVNPNGTLTLAPGAYGKLTAYAGSKVNLSSGTYAFSDLQIEPSAALRFTVTSANGPVVLYVDKVTSMRGKIESTVPSIPTAKSVLFVHRGTTNVRFETSANMAIVSPTARIELATGGTTYQGSVFARGLLLEPDVKLTYVPFEYWDWILPAKPFVSCVLPVGLGKYMAAFGFDNGRTVAMSAPHGPQNRFVPASALGHLPPTSLPPGHHEEAVWVDMPAGGVTWELFGHTVTATLNSPGCKLPSPDAPVAGSPPAGASRPSRSLPYAPSALAAPNGTNVTGPGTFVLPSDSASGWPGGVTTGDVPLEPTDGLSTPDVDVPLGLTKRTTDKLHLTVHATPSPSEQDPAGIHIGIQARVDGTLFFEEVVEGGGTFCEALPCTGDRTYELTVPLGSSQPMQVDFYAWEYNEHSSSEATLVLTTLDPVTGEISVLAESGPTGPLTFGAMNQAITGILMNGHAGDEFPVIDYAGNTYRFTIDLEKAPTPLQAETRLCVDWTAYFVDTAVPGQPFEEGFPGIDLAAVSSDPALVRLRAHDAAFAQYWLRIRGPFASYRVDGDHLDADGCLTVPSLALTYVDGAPRGAEDEGVVLQMTVQSHFEQPTPEGAVTFQVADEVAMKWGRMRFAFNSFDEGTQAFVLQDGMRLAPADLDLAGSQFDHETSVAATISRGLQELTREGIVLPIAPGSGLYRVKVNDGHLTEGARDHLCAHVPSSYAVSSVLYIGPGHFPCESDGQIQRTCNQNQTCTTDANCPSGTTCSNERCTLDPLDPSTAECRRACVADDDCGGGQHCADPEDFNQGCDGGSPCFCAYPGQGTMKYVTAHEFGHVVQNQFLGVQNKDSYAFYCPVGTDCSTLGRVEDGYLVDPQGMDALCGCQHVIGSTAAHCLQSVERSSAAQIEGFGHYFATKVWNGTGSGDCLFNYYKEFFDEGTTCHGTSGPNGTCRSFTPIVGAPGTVTEAPIPLNCGTARKWRNTHGCGVDPQNPTADPNTFAQEVSTEYDWMTFLRGAEEGGIAFMDIMSIYNHACHPENQQFDAGGESLPICAAGQTPVANGCYAPAARCADDVGYGVNRPLPTYWFDRTIDPPVSGAGRKLDRGGFLSGARRKWGELDSRTGDVERLGLDHGVDEHADP